MATPPWTQIEDYKAGGGWIYPEQAAVRSRACCELLERGEILLFSKPPFEFSPEDQGFLVSQKWDELRLHKNVSYRPGEDRLRGASGEAAAIERLHSVLKRYSAHVLDFMAKFLAPYAGKWTLDFASFRPFEERDRDLPLHKRNDLLHVDAFPSRPTHGGRILRVFTNLNPAKSRVWQTVKGFENLARQYANDAGLQQATDSSFLGRAAQSLGGKLGVRAMSRTPYDTFMLRFHNYLKENEGFQSSSSKTQLEFPPLATWLVYTDGVAHAATSGQYAVEQTLLIPPAALVNPEQAPYRILEKIAGRALVS
jgi:3-deoxy-D-manno-oct-2-ulosonic acid (Kdo) hydroxylase